MSLVDFHAWWAWVVIATTGIAGVWGLVAHRWEQWQRREFWWFASVAHVSMAVQVTVGVAVLQTTDRTVPSVHQFYGFVALASVAIIYSYRQQMEHMRYLLYGAGSLWLMGLGIRSFFLTGPI